MRVHIYSKVLKTNFNVNVKVKNESEAKYRAAYRVRKFEESLTPEQISAYLAAKQRQELNQLAGISRLMTAIENGALPIADALSSISKLVFRGDGTAF